jgi:hypothetical protein
MAYAYGERNGHVCVSVAANVNVTERLASTGLRAVRAFGETVNVRKPTKPRRLSGYGRLHGHSEIRLNA